MLPQCTSLFSVHNTLKLLTSHSAILWLWIGCYGFFLDPVQFVIVSEIFPTTLRAK
jgi:hypothetical protein